MQGDGSGDSRFPMRGADTLGVRPANAGSGKAVRRRFAPADPRPRRARCDVVRAVRTDPLRTENVTPSLRRRFSSNPSQGCGAGIEPATVGLLVRCSNQLSYPWSVAGGFEPPRRESVRDARLHLRCGAPVTTCATRWDSMDGTHRIDRGSWTGAPLASEACDRGGVKQGGCQEGEERGAEGRIGRNLLILKWLCRSDERAKGVESVKGVKRESEGLLNGIRI